MCDKGKDDRLVFLAVTASIVACLVYGAATAVEFKDAYMDDAYIGFRCVQNFLSGRGFVFNPGERIEGVTNIGWLVLITPLAAVTGPHVAGKVLGGLLYAVAAVASILLFLSVSRGFSGSAVRVVIAAIIPVATCTSPAFVYFSHSGMETSALCVILLIAVRVSGSRARISTIWTGIVCGLAFAVRPETAILYPLYLFFSRVMEPAGTDGSAGPKPPLLAGAVAWAAAVGAITVARFAYFGSLLPNTFHAKPSSVGFILSRAYLFLGSGLTTLPQPMSGFLALPLFILGAAALARRAPRYHAMISAAAATGIIFSVYSASDWTAMPRYVAPYLAFVYLAIVAGLHEALSHTLRHAGGLILFLAFFIVLGNFVDHARFLGPEALAKYPGFIISAGPLERAAAVMAEKLPADSVIACKRIGALGYRGGFEVFDFVNGLPHGDVVATRADSGGKIFEDPRSPALASMWRKRRPTHILEDRSKLRPLIVSAGEDFTCFTVQGTVFREIFSFPIGKNEDWVLLEAAPGGVR